jgi:hypothetical protein
MSVTMPVVVTILKPPPAPLEAVSPDVPLVSAVSSEPPQPARNAEMARHRERWTGRDTDL